MSFRAEPLTSKKLSNPAILINRLAGILAWAGVYIAGVLTYAHYSDQSVPCGPSGGCATVARHETSMWGPVPVAVVGLVGYLLLLVLAMARQTAPLKFWKPLCNVSLMGTVFGFLASAYFIFISLNEIKATCLWCIASAVVMTASLITTWHLWSLDIPSDEAKPPRDFGLQAVVGGVALLSIFGTGFLMHPKGDLPMPSVASLTEEQILPVAAKIRGDRKSKIRIVEFADINCGACRSSTKNMAEIYKLGNGNVLWAFRHFPLPKLSGHETSTQAAILAELAAEKGVFWPFLDALFDDANTERVKSMDGLKQIALDSGLKIDDIGQALTKDSDYAKNVVADVDIALRIGVDQTPVFLIMADGTKPKAVTGRRLPEVMLEEPYKSLLGGG